MSGKSVYDSEYLVRRGHDQEGTGIFRAKVATARHYLAMAERVVRKGALLEVGCSTGILLKEALERGWEVHGVEVNATAASMASRAVMSDTIESRPVRPDMFPGKLFSLILLMDVIEHIDDPVGCLTILKAKLAPAGVILMVTPDAGSLSLSLLGGGWPHLMPEHTRLYSRRSMDKLLETCGLGRISSGWARKYVSAGVLVRHLECHPDVFLARELRALLGRLLPEHTVFPFNIGEMYVLSGAATGDASRPGPTS